MKRPIVVVLVALVALGAAALAGYIIGLSAGAHDAESWTPLVALSGLSLAERSASDVYRHGGAQEARSALRQLVARANGLEKVYGGQLANDTHNVKALAYTRLALLERQAGNDGQAEVAFQSAVAEARAANWRDPSPKRLVAVVQRLDRIEPAQSDGHVPGT